MRVICIQSVTNYSSRPSKCIVYLVVGNCNTIIMYYNIFWFVPFFTYDEYLPVCFSLNIKQTQTQILIYQTRVQACNHKEIVQLKNENEIQYDLLTNYDFIVLLVHSHSHS